MSVSNTKTPSFSHRYQQYSTSSYDADQLHRSLSDNVDVHRERHRVSHQAEEADVARFQLVVSHKFSPALTKAIPPVLDPEYSFPSIFLAGTLAPKPHSLVLLWKVLCRVV